MSSGSVLKIRKLLNLPTPAEEMGVEELSEKLRGMVAEMEEAITSPRFNPESPVVVSYMAQIENLSQLLDLRLSSK
jgi:hypothetical protein